MTRNIENPIYVRRFPKTHYPDVPELAMVRDNPAATDLARLVVMLAVDQRGQSMPRRNWLQYPFDWWRAGWLVTAGNTNGYEATADLLDGTLADSMTKVIFSHRPDGRSGLLTRTRNFISPDNLSLLAWRRDHDGMYVPVDEPPSDGLIRADASVPVNQHALAFHYAELVSGINDPDAPMPLRVVRTEFTPYHIAPEAMTPDSQR